MTTVIAVRDAAGRWSHQLVAEPPGECRHGVALMAWCQQCDDDAATVNELDPAGRTTP